MCKVLTVNSMKGGITKSTITYEMSYILSSELYNKRVLCISLDPQCDLDTYVGYSNKDKIGLHTIYNVFKAECTIKDAIVPTNHGFDMILSDKRLINADKEFTDVDDYYILKDLLEYMSDYDYIIIDTNRARGFISTAIFYAVDYVIIPCLNDEGSLNAIFEVNNDINVLKKRNLSHAKILGLVLSRYKNTTEHKESDELLLLVAKKLECKKFSPIRDAIAVDKSKKRHMPVTKYKKWDNVSMDFRKFTKEVIEQINLVESGESNG